MASLAIDTRVLVEQNYPEYFGNSQTFALGEMTSDLVPPDFWGKLLGNRTRGASDHDFLADLQQRAGDVWLTGSAVREVWSGYPSTEAKRELPELMDPRLVAGVKQGRFGARVDIQHLHAEAYLGMQLATYLLPPNLDIRFDKTEWPENEAVPLMEQIVGRFGAMKGWEGSLTVKGGMRELAFTNPECGAAGVCFYFKEHDRGGRGMMTTAEWEGVTNARLWRRVQIERDKMGRILAKSPAMPGRKNDIWCQEPQAITSVGQRYELLARSIREIVMTGRMPQQLEVETFGDPASLEKTWTLRQWCMYVGNLIQACVNNPRETAEMLTMIGAGRKWITDEWPISPEQVMQDLQSYSKDSAWRPVLAQADRIAMQAGDTTSRGGEMKLADLAPLVEVLSPVGMGVEEVLALVPTSDQREVVTKVL